MEEAAPIRLAAIRYDRGYDVDRLLVAACASLTASGLRLGGLLQVATGARDGDCTTNVRVADLRTGRLFGIWQDRGRCARGCRLDEGGLAESETAVQQAISDRVDLLVINRFGRAESFGRGLRGCFDAALFAGVPVLTAVRAPYDSAWQEFHGGFGTDLGCEIADILAWASHCMLPTTELPQALSMGIAHPA